MVFLMTDAQVSDEKFLVVINDLLVSGEIPELFSEDEFANIINISRNEVKSMGMDTSQENCWRYFIDKVRRTLKVKAKTICKFIIDFIIRKKILVQTQYLLYKLVTYDT